MAPACSSHSASAAATEHLSRGYERLTQLRALLFSASPADCNSPRAALQAVELLDKALRSLSAALAELHTSSPPARKAITHGDQKDGSARKRRTRIQSSWIIITTVPHFDGHQWRKYGQKHIHGTIFPRSYYKCTNSKDQGCPATKTVQEKGGGYENQPKFEVSYNKLHTCKATQLESEAQHIRSFVMDSSAANSASNNSAASPTPSHQSTNNSGRRGQAASPYHDDQPFANLEAAENYEHDDQHLIDAMQFELGDDLSVKSAAEMNMLSPLAAFHGFAWEELLS